MSGYGNAYIGQPFSYKSLVSVSSSASMPGGVRGIYANTTCGATFVANDGSSSTFYLPTGVSLFVNAAYCSQLTIAASNDLIQLT